jgi:hypothetical protein
MQGRQETAERAAAERFAGAFALVPAKRLHALLARDALALVAEDHRVTVEGDAQLAGRATGIDLVGRRGGGLAGRLGQDGRRGDAMAQRAAHRFRVGRQEQVGAERLHVRPGRLAGGERRAMMPRP